MHSVFIQFLNPNVFQNMSLFSAGNSALERVRLSSSVQQLEISGELPVTRTVSICVPGQWIAYVMNNQEDFTFCQVGQGRTIYQDLWGH